MSNAVVARKKTLRLSGSLSKEFANFLMMCGKTAPRFRNFFLTQSYHKTRCAASPVCSDKNRTLPSLKATSPPFVP
jgi:hypothetical protein